MTRTEIERRLGQARWPEPAAELRARVLTATPIDNRPVTWSDRVWFSRAFRLAAAATFIGAVAIGALSDPRANGIEAPTGIALAEVRVIDDAGQELGLPGSLTAALRRRVLVSGASRTASDRQRLAIETVDVEGNRR